MREYNSESSTDDTLNRRGTGIAVASAKTQRPIGQARDRGPKKGVCKMAWAGMILRARMIAPRRHQYVDQRASSG